ncbi:hypothetical protein [Parasitella parasitica]|uniref:Uncharacterized protein n=1 Tax=Parasitella parasitica TaxID=35722 RepID=A0A0B7NLI4_9FUNG|nr:hypothetical protein [Parasitella parasitica]
MQYQQPSLRQLLIQFVNTFKHSFEFSKVSCEQTSTDIANAKLSQFEKTYVSFPEFIDIGVTTPTDAVNQHHSHQLWLQHSSTLTC